MSARIPGEIREALSPFYFTCYDLVVSSTMKPFVLRTRLVRAWLASVLVGSIASISLAAAPSAPADVYAVPRDEAADLHFSIDDGGTPLSRIEVSLDGGATWTFSSTDVTPPVRVTGLMNEAMYEIVVRLVNADGTSPASDVAEVIPRPGVAYAWGSDSGGELGDGPGQTPNSTVPVEVLMTGALAGKSVESIHAQFSNICALTSDNSLVCWGSGSSGQIGNGLTQDAFEPVLVEKNGELAGKEILKVGTGSDHTCALLGDGSIVCWGSNLFKQLGDGTSTSSLVPVRANAGVLAGKRFVDLAVGSAFNCAIDDVGDAYCWGNNVYGTLGNGTVGGTANDPVAVTMNGVRFQQLRAGAFGVCAIATTGTPYCWGDNSVGQVGSGSADAKVLTPEAVDTTGVLSGKTIRFVDTSGETVCVILEDGSLACWGANATGTIGDGTTDDRPAPVSITASGPLADKRIHDVATRGNAFGGHTCATTTEGEGYCWGMGAYGVLGNGTQDTLLLPDAVLMEGREIYGVETLYYTTVAWGPAPVSSIPAPAWNTVIAASGRAWLDFERVDGALEYAYKLDDGAWVSFEVDEREVHPVSGLTNGQTYSIRLRARTADGWSVAGLARTVTPNPVSAPNLDVSATNVPVPVDVVTPQVIVRLDITNREVEPITELWINIPVSTQQTVPIRSITLEKKRGNVRLGVESEVGWSRVPDRPIVLLRGFEVASGETIQLEITFELEEDQQ